MALGERGPFGTVALGGLGLIHLAATNSPPPRARPCVLLYMDGGPSHIDLFDLKPDAPAEVRGPFQPVTTSVPGTHVCEHLPRVAWQMVRCGRYSGADGPPL